MEGSNNANKPKFTFDISHYLPYFYSRLICFYSSLFLLILFLLGYKLRHDNWLEKFNKLKQFSRYYEFFVILGQLLVKPFSLFFHCTYTFSKTLPPMVCRTHQITQTILIITSKTENLMYGVVFGGYLCLSPTKCFMNSIAYWNPLPETEKIDVEKRYYFHKDIIIKDNDIISILFPFSIFSNKFPK